MTGAWSAPDPTAGRTGRRERSGDTLAPPWLSKGRTRAQATPIAADGRIYLASVAGKLTVLKAGGDKPEILHQAEFGDRILASPAVVGDRLYLRTQKTLYCFGSEGGR